MSIGGTEEKRFLTILWRIENFSFWEHGFRASEIGTPLFRSQLLDESPCYLRMCHNEENVDDTRLPLSFILSGEALGYMINCEWSFLDSDGFPLASGIVIKGRFTELVLHGCPLKKDVFVTQKSLFLPHDTLTVRFRISKNTGDFPQAERFSILTRVHIGEHSLLWTSERFSTLKLGQTEHKLVYLPCFPRVEDAVLLTFALMGPSLLNSMVNCTIFKNQNCHPTLMKVKVSVLDNGQQAITCGEQTLEYSWSNLDSCIPKIVSRKELLVKKYECLRGDVLTLLCVITYFTGHYNSLIEKTYLGPSNLEIELPRNDAVLVSEASCQTLQQKSVDFPGISSEKSHSIFTLGDDFLSLYRGRSLSDFELRSGDGIFPVHKLVLSARSQYFRDLFSSDKNSDLKFLEIEDVEDHTLERILTFLYAGIVDDLQWEDAEKLYHAAHKYQVPSLQQECSSVIRSSISVSNVCDILALADRHRDHELTSFVYDFILDHYDDVLVSDEWGTFRETESYLGEITALAVSKERLYVKKRTLR